MDRVSSPGAISSVPIPSSTLSRVSSGLRNSGNLSRTSTPGSRTSITGSRDSNKGKDKIAELCYFCQVFPPATGLLTYKFYTEQKTFQEARFCIRCAQDFPTFAHDFFCLYCGRRIENLLHILDSGTQRQVFCCQQCQEIVSSEVCNMCYVYPPTSGFLIYRFADQKLGKQEIRVCVCCLENFGPVEILMYCLRCGGKLLDVEHYLEQNGREYGNVVRELYCSNSCRQKNSGGLLQKIFPGKN